MYNFEKHQKLTNYIQEMANSGRIPKDWSGFLAEIDHCLQLPQSCVVGRSEQLCINCKEKPANRGLGKHKLLCSDCWSKLCD